MVKIKTMRGFSKEGTEGKAKRVFGKKYKNIKVKTGKKIGKSKGGQTIKEYHVSGQKR